MDKLIQLTNICKRYKKEEALHNVSLHFESGKIYGLVGPNGAGKTTLLRIIGGFAFANQGELLLWNERENLERYRHKMGMFIEFPRLDFSLTAYENLKYVEILRGKNNCRNINEVLAMVGLEDAKDKKVIDFSHGMKQRLGLGCEILHNPGIMILDEPLNGLDPDGIIEIRNLILRLNAENEMTFIISSHLLDELYKVATDYVFIKKGKIVDILSAQELEKKCESYLEIKVDNIEKMEEVLKKELKIEKYILENNTFYLYDHFEDVAKISKAITAENVTILKFFIAEESLEKYYLRLMGEK